MEIGAHKFEMVVSQEPSVACVYVCVTHNECNTDFKLHTPCF
jgi:hypothetical protein